MAGPQVLFKGQNKGCGTKENLISRVKGGGVQKSSSKPEQIQEERRNLAGMLQN